MIRLFVALDLQSKTKKDLERFAHNLKLPAVRLINETNLHITLKFLGYTEDNLLKSIDEVLRKVAQRHAPFNITLDSLGAFPSKRKARVLWLGSKSNDKISHLVADIDKSLKKLDFKTEKRDYKIHLTLARFKNNTDLSKYIEKYFEPINENIKHIVLFESKLSPKGAQYKVLKKYLLKSS